MLRHTVTIATLWLCPAVFAFADDLKSIAGSRKLVLPPANSTPVDATGVIDNAALARIAAGVRFSAVASVPEANETPSREPGADRNLAQVKERWRKRHRKAVEAIHRLQDRIRREEAVLETLKDGHFHATSEKQRIGLDPKIDAGEQAIADLNSRLVAARAVFSRTIRQARLEGATPGWFRDLPRP